MIYIKTRMRRMPECCRACAGYMRPSTVQSLTKSTLCANGIYEGRCGAVIGYTYGKRFDKNFHVSKERPAWCPLVEREESK